MIFSAHLRSGEGMEVSLSWWDRRSKVYIFRLGTGRVKFCFYAHLRLVKEWRLAYHRDRSYIFCLGER